MSNLHSASAAGGAATHQISALAARYRTLIKYFVIGAAASAIDVLLFLFLYNLVGATPLLAHSISVPTAVLFSFFINARHNFKTTDHTALRLLSFVIVCTIGYGAGYGVIELCRAAGLGANLGKVVSLPVVFILQYALNSRITFHKAQGGAQAEGAA